MSEKLNLSYVKKAIDSGSEVSVYLINGVSLQGKILDQDDVALIMTSNKASTNKKQLVFKHAISTIIT